MENSLFYTQFSPLNAVNCLLGLCNFQIFWGSIPPDTPWNRGLLIQSVTLFKSAGYFNFYWNPCLSDYEILTFSYKSYAGHPGFHRFKALGFEFSYSAALTFLFLRQNVHVQYYSFRMASVECNFFFPDFPTPKGQKMWDSEPKAEKSREKWVKRREMSQIS